MVQDPAGNLVGTADYGGADHYDGGDVFKLSPTGKETVLHSFDFTYGEGPESSLLPYRNYLYGTTPVGGTTAGSCGTFGCGVVFKITP